MLYEVITIGVLAADTRLGERQQDPLGMDQAGDPRRRRGPHGADEVLEMSYNFV